MKRKASNDNCTSRKTVNERRRPPSDQSDIGSNCKCGGVSGNVLCKRAVICSKCKKCEFGCRRDVYCKARIPLRIYTNNEIALRKNKKVHYKENDISLDDNTKIMKRKASNAKGISRNNGFSQRRSPSDQSDIRSNCNCGGVSGNVLCKRAIFCSKCNKCEYGCRRDVNCKSPIPLRIATNNEIELRKNERVDYNEKDFSLDDNTEKVYHRNLSLTTATVTDLATAYGRRTFFIPGAQRTLDNLHTSKFYNEVNITDEPNGSLRRCFYPLRIIMNNALDILAGGGQESQQLKALFLEREFHKVYQQLHCSFQY